MIALVPLFAVAAAAALKSAWRSRGRRTDADEAAAERLSLAEREDEEFVTETLYG
ncbi:MAG: hypothetical protein M0D55_13930 [Elusimicrobiota bacterium]|nr:MAG: hypothetical protein M0D55_13930 [Elusimicrobiota bacterium]